MPKDEMNKLFSLVHKDITIYNYDKHNIPCIIFDEKKFDEIINKVSGKPISVNTNLNILQDGLGHVFVEVSLEFSNGDINEKILLYANDSMEFFELLAKTSMLALSSIQSKEKVFMIQLPKPEKAVNALDIIRKGLRRD